MIVNQFYVLYMSDTNIFVWWLTGFTFIVGSEEDCVYSVINEECWLRAEDAVISYRHRGRGVNLEGDCLVWVLLKFTLSLTVAAICWECQDELSCVCVCHTQQEWIGKIRGAGCHAPLPWRTSASPFWGPWPDACHALTAVPHTEKHPHTHMEMRGSWPGLTSLILPNGFSIQGLTS